MGRFITTTGTAATTVREISSAYDAQVNDRILLDSTSGSFTVTLPPNAELLPNDTIQFADVVSQLGNNSVTVARNGSLIQSEADDLTLDVRGAVVTLLYSGPTYGWVIIGT